MIFTNQEMQQIRDMLELQSGLDDELLYRCAPLIHSENFDEAVRNGCVLLEERLRTVVEQDGLFGVGLINQAFHPQNGQLAPYLGKSSQEKQGVYNLFTGAFQLFRNPSAHTFVGYTVEEGKAILYFINLLLIFLERAAERTDFQENWEIALQRVEPHLGYPATLRLRTFLGKCSRELNLDPGQAKQQIPYRYYGLARSKPDSTAKRTQLRLFFFQATPNLVRLRFPITDYYSKVVGFDTDWLKNELRAIGLHSDSKSYYLDLKKKNDETTLERLLTLLAVICQKLDDSLDVVV